MSKVITSVTVFNDAVGLRMSATYSEIDDAGRVVRDNQRFDRVVRDADAKSAVNDLFEYATNVLGD